MTADDDALEALLAAVYRAYHHDFRHYARASLRRRVAAALGPTRCDTVADLQARVLADPAVFAQLLRHLTAQVSELFRDPPYYAALRALVVPHLATYPHLRVWVPGCAAGEEAYALAIVLREAGLLHRTQIYATDIGPESLRVAEAATYSLDRFARWSDAYREAGGRGSLADHYRAAYDRAIFDPALRQAILFSDHSLATDAAFAEVQLVSCRNVLIYFDQHLQERALGVLHDALCRRGFLGLGSKESLRDVRHASRFTALDHDARIYRKQ